MKNNNEEGLNYDREDLGLTKEQYELYCKFADLASKQIANEVWIKYGIKMGTGGNKTVHFSLEQVRNELRLAVGEKKMEALELFLAAIMKKLAGLPDEEIFPDEFNFKNEKEAYLTMMYTEVIQEIEITNENWLLNAGVERPVNKIKFANAEKVKFELLNEVGKMRYDEIIKWLEEDDDESDDDTDEGYNSAV